MLYRNLGLIFFANETVGQLSWLSVGILRIQTANKIAMPIWITLNEVEPYLIYFGCIEVILEILTSINDTATPRNLLFFLLGLFLIFTFVVYSTSFLSKIVLSYCSC